MKKYILLLSLPLLLLTACKKDFSVERSIVIDAPSDVVWQQIKYFKNWKNWSPWYDKEPSMVLVFTGTDGELESSYSWMGEESGSGEITNTGVTEGEELLYHTNFYEPWESESDGYLILSEVEGGTEVKWGFTGEIQGVASLFMNMDKMVGPDFEKGLLLLKEVSVTTAAAQPKLTVQETTIPESHYITLREDLDITSLQNFFVTNYGKLTATGIEPVGSPSALYYSWDFENMKTDVAAAIPVAPGTIAPDGIELTVLPAAKALLVDYYGDYESLGTAHELLETYMNTEKFEFIGPAIEVYVTDPMTETDPNKWLTKVIYPVK